MRSLAHDEFERLIKKLVASDTPGVVATHFKKQQERIEQRIEKGKRLALVTYSRLHFFFKSSQMGEVARGKTALPVALTNEGIDLSGAFVLNMKEAIDACRPEEVQERLLNLLNTKKTAVMEQVRWLQLRRGALVEVLARYDDGDVPLSEEKHRTAGLSFATRSQRKHLRRARLVLDRHGDEISTRGDFCDKAAETKWPNGVDEASGGSIWRSVKRLGKAALDLQKHEPMPAQYNRLSGFERLVRDLQSGALSPPG